MKVVLNIRLLFLHILLFGIVATAVSVTGNSFISNKGQILDQNKIQNDEVLYMYSGKGLNIQLRKTGYSYEFFSVNKSIQLQGGKKSIDAGDISNILMSSHRVDIDFLEMNNGTEIIAFDEHEEKYNYHVSEKSITSIPAFGKVLYKNVYAFTDIEFLATNDPSSPVKYNIILHPGADLSKVKFLCRGAKRVEIQNGSVLIDAKIGDIQENIPFSYYTDAPEKNNEINFKLSDNTISFDGKYDNSRTMVIDPATNRIWGTYFGGTSYDFCTSNAIDASNNVYLAGYTLSTANIATIGAYQTVHAGSYDAYLAKFNSNGSLLWSTYFGGSGFDIFYAVHISPTGLVYTAGDTDSNSGVTTAGAHQTVYGGGIDDALITRFNSAGQLLWSTYYGGNDHDMLVALTTDNNGNIVVAGHTRSNNNISTPGSYNPTYSLVDDVLLAKFDSLGARTWGTYYGDTGIEEALAVACDASDNIYITGFTTSIFSISTGGAHQSVNGGSQDAFVSKFNSSGSSLLWGTFYGGAGIEQGNTIEIDNVSGKLFIAGSTTSTNNIASTGAFQTTIASADDAFLGCFNLSGINQWGTYFGGNDVDYINDLLIDPNKDLVFCGSTLSTNSISTAGAYQPSLALVNYYDAFFSKFSPTGFPKLGTYYGGDDNDNARAMVMDNAGKIYLAGETSSSVSIASTGAYSTVYGGFGDGFLAKFCLAPEPFISPAGTSTVCFNNSFTLTASSGFPTYQWSNGSNLNPLIIPPGTPPGTYNYAVTVSDGFGCDATSDSTTVIFDPCLSITESQTQNQIRVFPIPAKDFIEVEVSVELNTPVRIDHYNAIGQLINTYFCKENKLKIGTEKLSPGIYYLSINTGNTIVQKKFIKD
jgi:hypothetical protein